MWFIRETEICENLLNGTYYTLHVMHFSLLSVLRVTYKALQFICYQDVRQESTESVFSLLRIPTVLIMGLCLTAGSAGIGFIDVSLSIYLTDQVG